MAKSEKRNQKGPPKVRGWLRHLPRLETSEQGTGAALNKYGVFFPYKHRFFDLVPSGLWLYNPHLCWCGSKMLNTISMGWFQGNSGEQHKNETQFYHLTTWSRHKFSQKHPLTPSISHIPCPSPGASCWTHLSRGTGRWFRFSPKSEGKGHTLLLWGMPKPWGITCLELLMGLTEHWWSSFFRRTSLSPELSHVSLHLCCTGFSTSQWGWPELQSRDSAPGCRAELSVSLQDSSSPRNALNLPVMGHSNTIHNPFEGGHSTAVAAGFQSQPEAKAKCLL